MNKFNNILKGIFKYVKGLTVGNDSFKYAVFYGIISSTIIFLKLISSFFMYDATKISNFLMYFICSMLMLLILIVLIVIQQMKISSTNKFATSIVQLFPFYILTVGSITAFLYVNPFDAIFSYFVILIILSWAQIYRAWRRIILFSYGFIIFSLIGILCNGNLYFSSNYIVFSIMSIFIAYITASIHNQIFINNISAMDELDSVISKTNIAYAQVGETNKELLKSKAITKSMFEITQEILKNERFEDVLQLVLDKAVSLIPDGQAGSILILDKGKMKFVAAKGYDLRKLHKIELLPEDLYQATLTDKYEPTIIKNLETFDQVHIGEQKTQKFKESVVIAKSCLTCSFQYEGEFFGVINIDNFDSEDIFKEYDMYLIKQLAQELELIISIHELYEQAIRPTKFDELTQASTRTYCIKLLKNLINMNPKDNIAICTLDVNNLKTVNDEYGHDIGDKYLAYFADCIRNATIKENIFGRIGGDEFLLIFHNLDKDGVSQQIDIIRKYMSDNSFKLKKHEEKITFAAGIAMYPTDDNNLNNLIKLSDKKMYEDKQIQKQL